MGRRAVAAIAAEDEEFTNMETRFATAHDGTRIAYDMSGTGPLLILLHGLGSTRASWHEAGVVDALAGEWTVAATDLRGHGESDKPRAPEAYAIETVLGDVEAVITARGGVRVHILDGLDHQQLVTERDVVLPVVRAFLRA